MASTCGTTPNNPAARGPKKNVLLAVSGSVAAIKVPEIVARLAAHVNVRIVTTRHARHFFQLPPGFVQCPGGKYNREQDQQQVLYSDADEWTAWAQMGDPVLHIELRKWADILLVAPCSANTLSKLANGACDNLLTCVARCWDIQHCAAQLIVAPAMNTLMWDSPFTRRHIQILEEVGMTIVQPVAKKLACGDVGVGALASPQTLETAVLAQLAAHYS